MDDLIQVFHGSFPIIDDTAIGQARCASRWSDRARYGQVRSVLDAANADDALVRSKAAVSSDRRLFMCRVFLDEGLLELPCAGRA